MCKIKIYYEIEFVGEVKLGLYAEVENPDMPLTPASVQQFVIAGSAPKERMTC